MKHQFSILKFFGNLIRNHTKESSKRFIAVGTMGLVSYVVLRFTTPENAEMMLVQLLGFVLILVGVSVAESVSFKKSNIEKNNKS